MELIRLQVCPPRGCTLRELLQPWPEWTRVDFDPTVSFTHEREGGEVLVDPSPYPNRELEGMSADTLLGEGITTLSLVEWFALDKRLGGPCGFLDLFAGRSCGTLLAGSRLADGRIPTICRYGGALLLRAIAPDAPPPPGVRARRVILP